MIKKIVPFMVNTKRCIYRVMGPNFADGINAPRIATSGNNLPLSRIVSRTMHPDDGFHDHAGTVMVIAWGQFMDHDYTLTATPLGNDFILIYHTFTFYFETAECPGDIRITRIYDARQTLRLFLGCRFSTYVHVR